jgi:hypothetical protein
MAAAPFAMRVGKAPPRPCRPNPLPKPSDPTPRDENRREWGGMGCVGCEARRWRAFPLMQQASRLRRQPLASGHPTKARRRLSLLNHQETHRRQTGRPMAAEQVIATHTALRRSPLPTHRKSTRRTTFYACSRPGLAMWLRHIRMGNSLGSDPLGAETSLRNLPREFGRSRSLVGVVPIPMANNPRCIAMMRT